MKGISQFIAVTLLCMVGTNAGAQTPQPGTPPQSAQARPPRGKIAVVNINKVIKGYNRANQLGQSVADQARVYQEKLNALRASLVTDQNKLATEKVPQLRDQIEKNITRITRDVQDLQAEAEKVIRTKQGDILVTIYKDIEGVVTAFAASNDLELVLSFPDAILDSDMNKPETIVRKLQSPAAMPIFYSKSIDLTDAVVDTLNKRFPAPPPAASSPQPQPQPQP